MTKIESLSVDIIKTNAGTQMRAKVDDDVVDTYADLWRNKHEFPPLDVFYDGTTYVLGDGFHRLYGAKQAKRSSVPCRVHKGGIREAVLFACSANSEHGLHRSRADKRLAVTTMLDDEEWCKRSQAWIAEMCNVSRSFVMTVNADRKPSVLDQGGAKHPAPSGGSDETRVTGRDGKSYPRKLPSQSDAPPTPAEDKPPTPSVSSGRTSKQDDAKEGGGSKGKITGGITFDTVGELSSESKDAFGTEPPEELRKVFELRVGFKEQRAKLTSIKTWLTQNQNHPGAAILSGAAQRIRTDVNHADNELDFATPYCVCVYCHNKNPKVANCAACKGLGWITEPIYKAAPKGMQREKAKG